MIHYIYAIAKGNSQDDVLRIARIAFIIRNKTENQNISDLDTILLNNRIAIVHSDIESTEASCCEE